MLAYDSSLFMILKSQIGTLATNFRAMNLRGHLLYQNRYHKTVAVIGAGPAGVSTTKTILKLCPISRVDIYEKLPVPYGLIRYGVAPDNLGAKNAVKLYNSVINDPRVRLFANVELGKHLGYRDLLDCYDVVVVAIGLNTPNTPPKKYLEINNVFLGDSFAKWYNGHPYYTNQLKPDLTAGTNMVILGLGNVSLDISRTLLTNIDILKLCDIPSKIQELIRTSKIRHITIIGRRGLDAVKFTANEIRSVTKSPCIKLIPRNREYINSLDPDTIKNIGRPVRILYEALKTPSETLSKDRSIEFEFFSTINDLIIDERTRKLSGIEILKNINGRTEVNVLPCDLLVFSHGYKQSKLEDIHLGEYPYIEVPEHNNPDSPMKKTRLPPGLFVSGYRTAMLGYNIANSVRVATITANEIASYLNTLSTPKVEGDPFNYIEKKLGKSGVEVIDFRGWTEINNLELLMGKHLGKAREKITSSNEMISVAKK